MIDLAHTPLIELVLTVDFPAMQMIGMTPA